MKPLDKAIICRKGEKVGHTHTHTHHTTPHHTHTHHTTHTHTHTTPHTHTHTHTAHTPHTHTAHTPHTHTPLKHTLAHTPLQIAALHQRMQDMTHAAYLCGTNVICYQEAWSEFVRLSL